MSLQPMNRGSRKFYDFKNENWSLIVKEGFYSFLLLVSVHDKWAHSGIPPQGAYLTVHPPSLSPQGEPGNIHDSFPSVYLCFKITFMNWFLSVRALKNILFFFLLVCVCVGEVRDVCVEVHECVCRSEVCVRGGVHGCMWYQRLISGVFTFCSL